MDVYSKSGKKTEDITLESVLAGTVDAEDIKISAEALNRQSDIAKRENRAQLAENFERAAELTALPDDVILNIYNKLRPHRATKAELYAIADELKNKYNALKCAALVLDAVDIYEKRGILL